jgi:hypothetical protein
MRLIGLAVILTVTLTLGPLAAEAQKTVKDPRIGILSTVSLNRAGFPGGSRP